jgi:hypothetical protein
MVKDKVKTMISNKRGRGRRGKRNQDFINNYC